ncbi:MAG: hypothetical protein ACE5IM_07145 [Nitrospinota bacterium]
MQVDSDKVKYFKAKDGRTVAVLVRGDLEEYAKFPPKIDSEEDREHMARHYDLSKIDMDTYTKAHVTDDELPLQIVLLNREKGSLVKPHYHKVLKPVSGESKFQLMMCQRGLGRIGVYTREGDHLGDVELRPFDFILLLEGHSIEFVEENTKLIELKQGPFPDHGDAEDMVAVARE